MSSNIENRIVKMQFENSKFESGIKESLKSLEKLKEGLKLDDAAKSIENLQKAGDSFSLAKIADGIETLSSRFSAFGIMGMRVLENLTDKAMAFVGKFTGGLKDLSIGQIDPGFGKYEDKTRAVQTIMSATGESMETIDEQLAKLNWFTDETSYNFVDMVGNIGKFTSVGVGLKPAVTAMQGIATWAADSGAGISEASRAMYNLSQAMGAGAVKKIDWKSIENANMATAKFKKNVIGTAIALGKLDKNGKTKGGTLVTVQNFAETLQKGWFDRDVLVKVLERYGNFADEVYAYTEKYNVPASEAIEALSGQFEQFSEDAFKAAQEAKTFTDAMDATRDAVSSGFMQMFENIFGNYEEAKVIWTKLANDMWEIFASPLESINELLHEWRGYREVIDNITGEPTGEERYNRILDGRIYLVNGLSDAFDGLLNVLNAVKEVFADIFPQTTADQLLDFSKRVEALGSRFKMLTEGYDTSTGHFEERITKVRVNPLEDFDKELKRGAKGEGVKILQERLQQLGYKVGEAGADGIFGPATEKALRDFQSDYHLAVTGVYDELTHTNLGHRVGLIEYVEEISESVEDIEHADFSQFATFKTILGGVFAAAHIVAGAFGALANVVGHVINLLKPLGDAFILIAEYIGQALINLDKWIAENDIFGDWFAKAQKFFEPFADWVQKAADALLAFFGIGKEASSSEKELVTFATIYENIKKSLDDSGVIKRVVDAYNNLKAAFKSVKTTLESTWKSTKTSLGNGISNILKGIPGVISTVLIALGSFASFILEKFSVVISKIPSIVSSIKDFFSALTFKGDINLGKGPGVLAKAQNFYDKVKEFLFGTKNKDGETTKIGALTRVGNLLKGDIDAFTEGLPEKEASNIKTKLEAIKGFIEDSQATLSQITAALSRLITGEGGEDKLNENTVGKIDEYRNSIKDVFVSIGQFFTDIYDGIRVLFTGDIMNTSLSSDGIVGLLKARSAIGNFFNVIRYIFTGDRGEYNSNWIDDETAGKIDSIRSSIIGVFGKIGNFFVSIYEAARILITGNLSENSVLADGGQGVLNFRNGISLFFAKVKYLFTGKGGDSIDVESREKIDSFRDGVVSVINAVAGFFAKVVEAIKILTTGNLSDTSSFTDGGQKILDFRNRIANFFEAVKYLFTGNGGDELNDSILDKLDEYRAWIPNAISSVGNFFKKVVEAVRVFFTGNTLEESSFEDGGKAILDFRNRIFSFFAAVRYLFTGNGADQLDGGTVERIDGYRETFVGVINSVKLFFAKAIESVKILITGKASDDSVLGDGANTVINIRDKVIGIFNTIKQAIASIIKFAGSIFGGKQDGRGIFGGIIPESGEKKGSFFGNLFKGIGSFLSSLGDTTKEILKFALIMLGIFRVIQLLESITKGIKKFTGGTGKTDFIKELGNTLLKLAAIIAVVVAAIYVLGSMDPAKLEQGLLAFVGIMIAILGFMGLSALFFKGDNAKSLKKIGNGILSFAMAIGVLVASVLVLSLIPWDAFIDGTIKMAILGGFMVVMLGILKFVTLLGGTKFDLKGLWEIGALIAILAIVASQLGKLETGVLIKGILALIAIMIPLTVLLGVLALTSRKNGKLELKGLFGITLLIGVMAIIVSTLGKLDLGTLAKGLASLALIVGMMSVLFVTLGLSTKNANVPGITAMILGIIGIMVVFTIAIEKVKDIDSSVMISFALGLSAMMLAFGVFFKLVGSMNLAGVGTAFVGLLAIATALGLVIAAFGGLSKIPGFQDVMNSGASSIGQIIGNIVAEIKAAEIRGLMQGIQDINGADTVIDEEALNNIKKAVNDFADFETGLPKFEPFDKILSWVSAGKATDMGVLMTDMSTFASGISEFSRGMAEFHANEYTQTDYETAKQMVSDFAAFNTGLPEYTDTDKLLSWLSNGKSTTMALTTQDMNTFAVGVTNFVNEMKNFDTSGYSDTDYETAKKMVDDFATFNSGLPEYSGSDKLLSWITKGRSTNMAMTTQDMNTFAVGVTNFVEQMKNFDTSGYVEADYETARKMVEGFATFNENLPEYKTTDKILKWLSDGKTTTMAMTVDDMAIFASGITTFVSGMKKFKTEDYDETKMTIAQQMVSSFAEFNRNLPAYTTSEKLLKWLTGDTKLSTIMQDMSSFAEGINMFTSAMSGIDSGAEIQAKTSGAIEIAQQVASFLTELSGLDLGSKTWLGKIFTGDEAKTTVFDSVVELADAMLAAKQKMGELSNGTFLSDFNVGIEAITTLARFLDLIQSEKLFVPDQYIGDEFTNLTGWIDDIVAMIQEFGDKVAEINNLGEVAALTSSFATLIETMIGGGSASTITTENFLGGILQIARDAMSTLGNMVPDFTTVGENIASGLATGIANGSGNVITTAARVAAAAFAAACKVLGVQSPSRQFAWIGQMSDEGLAKGLIDNAGITEEASENVASGMIDSAQNSLASLSSILAEGIDDTPVIRPIVDLTGAQDAANSIGSFFGDRSFGVTSNVMAKRTEMSGDGSAVTIQNGTVQATMAADSMNTQIRALNESINSLKESGIGSDQFQSMSEKFGDLAEAVTNMRVVLDTGVLVGSIGNQMDSQLGVISMRRGRGN